MTATNDALYGYRKSIKKRFPEAANPGEIWHLVDTSYPKEVKFVPLFDKDSGVPLLSGHPQNARNLVSAQISYAKSVLLHSYDPQSRGIPEAIPDPNVPGGFLLMGGKQLAKGCYRACTWEPENTNVMSLKKHGFQICVRPANLPVDVIDLIIAHNNLDNKGVRESLGDKVRKVPQVKLEFKAFLAEKEQSKQSLPDSGLYSYHQKYSNFIKDELSHEYPTWTVYKHAKQLYDNLAAMKIDIDGVDTFISWVEDFLKSKIKI